VAVYARLQCRCAAAEFRETDARAEDHASTMRGFSLFALVGAIDGPHRKLRSRRMPLVVAAPLLPVFTKANQSRARSRGLIREQTAALCPQRQRQSADPYLHSYGRLGLIAGVPGVKPLLEGVYFSRSTYREVHPAAFRTARTEITPSELIAEAGAIRIAMPALASRKVIVTSALVLSILRG